MQLPSRHYYVEEVPNPTLKFSYPYSRVAVTAHFAPLFLDTVSARSIVLSVGFYNSSYALN